ncbi:MAG: hypothetical protein ACLPV2_09900 [Steroidobacteraceae bacterium]
MTAVDYIKSHWLEWAALAIAGAVGWLITSTIAKPLREFWDDRRRAIEILRTDGAVGWTSSEERVTKARSAVRQAAARLAYHAEAGAPVVRIYSRLRGYDLGVAEAALRGLGDRVGETMPNDFFVRQCDAVRVCLGATGGMSRARAKEIRQLLQESVAKRDAEPS